MKTEKLISYNPANSGEQVGVVAMSTQADVSNAVQKAKKAFPAWKALSIEERGAYFKKLLPLYQNKIAAIAQMQTQEMGKPIKDSIGEVASLIGSIEFYLDIAPQVLSPDTVDETDTQKNVVHFEPYGVAGVILPWNYPALLFVQGTIQALLAGNTVVVKHSEENPLTSKLLQDVYDEAGFPEGVIQTIYGDGSVGQMLVDEEIDLIHFTGSSKTGRHLYKVAADKFIPAVLEMGGSSPGIIFDDANLDEMCACAVHERFDNCGQICCALKRLFVHESCYDDVVQKVVEATKAIKVGSPMDENTKMGPLVAPRQLDLLEAQVKDALDKGAKIELGGTRPEGLEGSYYNPTVLSNITKEMRVYTEETFGPVLPIMSFKTEEEAIELANDTEYGLSAFIYTQDSDKAARVASALESGNVAINDTSYFSNNSPFGGYKNSGIGSGGGKYGFQFVTQMKTVSVPKG